MLHFRSMQALSLLLLFVNQLGAQTTCQSYGVDFFNGGTFCVDNTLSEYFSFVTEWFGCTVNDTQGDVTPLLVNPSGDDFFCSSIGTMPDGADFTSTCNLPGEEVRKLDIISGTWTVVLTGLTFAYQRTFEIIAGPPVVVTAIPSITFSVTVTPTATATSTLTNTIPTTLPPSTVTVPSSTSTSTKIITPVRVTTTSTKYYYLTNYHLAFGKTTVTKTVSTRCGAARAGAFAAEATAVIDAIATKIPARLASGKKTTTTAKKTSATSAKATSTSKPKRVFGRKPRPEGVRPFDLDRRAPDLCTTTIINTATTVSITTTLTAPTSTFTSIVTTSTTVVITPPPVTKFSGIARTTITTTLPTPTLTITIPKLTITDVTNTIYATVTSTTTICR